LRRSHQCATIQLDFQLPERFNLTYVSADESGAKERPVIIHRAILGSVERMIAILTESFGGKWPFWISPRQSIVLTISDKLDSYAHKVREEIYAAGFECDFNSDAGTTLNKKVRNAQLDNYNFILVIGEKEQQQNTVNVRTRDNKVHGEVAVDEVIRRFREMAASKTNHSEEEFGSSSSNASVPTASLADVKLTEKEASEPLDSSKYC
jgi:threonyl-tRNA synthetase